MKTEGMPINNSDVISKSSIIFNEYEKFYIDLIKAEKLEYNDLIYILNSEKFIDINNKILCLIIDYINNDKITIKGNVDVKIFINSYIFATKSDNIFDNINDNVKNIQITSKKMIIGLQNVIKSNNIEQEIKNFKPLLINYLTSYLKLNDSKYELGNNNFGISKEQIMHEILIDRNFKMDYDFDNNDKLVLTKYFNIYDDNYFKYLFDKLTNTPVSYQNLFKLLEDIISNIQSISKGYSEFKEIKNIINIDELKNKSDDILNYEYCDNIISSIVCIILRIHKRIELNNKYNLNITTTWNKINYDMQFATNRNDFIKCFCNALKMLMNNIFIIKTDFANSNIKKLATIVDTCGILYEYNYFDNYIQSNNMNYSLTIQWIKNTIETLISSNEKISKNNIFNYAIVDLIADYPNWGGEKRKNSIPETMHLDTKRIEALNYYFHINIVSTIILVTINFELKNKINFDILSTITDILIKNSPNIYNINNTIKLIVEYLNNNINDINTNLIKNIMSKNINKTNIIYPIFQKKFKKIYLEIINNDNISTVEICKKTNMESLVIPIIDDIKKKIFFVKNMITIQKQIHGKEYDKIINNFIDNKIIK
jgi:hypothetical protein